MKRAAGIIFRTALLVTLGVVIGVFISNRNLMNQSLGFSLEENDKISKVLNLVQQRYVDSINVDSIEGVTVNNMLQHLDPHSIYLPEQKATSINEGLSGGFTGIGIEYQLLRDTMVITQIYPGGPAAKAGLVSGDRIIDVDGKKFSGTHLTVKKVNTILHGQNNSPMVLAVSPPGSYIKKSFTLKRGHVPNSTIDAAYMAGPMVGYIKISKFGLTTDADFREAIAKLKTEGLQKLVLDLRGNGGGYLNTATALADEFLTKGKLIVYTQGAHEERRDYFATDSGSFQTGKVAVMIDEYSASASEILAGALQDLDRAVIVGRRSFGKGLVQQQFAFGDGSAVNLTIARYYTPSGRSIQKSYKGGIESYHNEIAERMRKGELFSAQSNLNDSIFKKPSPYHTASGRKVFSGGGIMPDVFVPADTTGETYLLEDLSDQQLFTAYTIDTLQPVLNSFSSSDDFIKKYEVSDDDFRKFMLYASQTIKEVNPQEALDSKSAIKAMLKASAARFKWGDNAYFEAMNVGDETLLKAIQAVD
ncbi:S41 family peptidase [Mucilaginibacter sp. L3T2-6]|uniref:S41 family peptidase n=1 Tax=Mucilaginibacter sp. L3T2-6 TaxID=3062491 RepID=UPI002676B1C5|nr:S41 family peptidase [Mucilaginibacter sp. L3T2-6]MDO3642541.1 S41 family peptidase [Mucilaginibacter sp. L3T2-6]MDV6215063.1 S41 family peptidase [Mucilaginibacter sp. L3T2-6]